MKYHEYFSVFLDIEEELLSFIKVLPYSSKSKPLYSHKLMLLLLQTCPVIESYMVRLSTLSPTVINSDLYGWTYNWRLWEKKEKTNEVKLRNGQRVISSFPKFAYISEKVFELSQQEVTFYYTNRFQDVADLDREKLKPYISLSKFEDYQMIKDDPMGVPKGLDTPKWWTAYNKIKHTFESQSKERVNYQVVIESIAGLFVLLCYCDPDLPTLEKHGYVFHENSNKVIRTKLFSAGMK